MFARQVNEHLHERSLAEDSDDEFENGFVHMPIDDGGDVPGLNGLRHHLSGQLVRSISFSQ